MIRRVLAITAIVVTALLLESTVFSDLKLLGVRPELMYLVTIVIAILEGPREGMVVGFAGGMAQDFLLNQPKGITALDPDAGRLRRRPRPPVHRVVLAAAADPLGGSGHGGGCRVLPGRGAPAGPAR